MNQKFSWAGFSAGLTLFLGTATELVTEHTTWGDFTTPIGVVHLLVLGASFVAMIMGALGIQLPRSDAHYGDRRTDAPPPPAPAPVTPPVPVQPPASGETK